MEKKWKKWRRNRRNGEEMEWLLKLFQVVRAENRKDRLLK